MRVTTSPVNEYRRRIQLGLATLLFVAKHDDFATIALLYEGAAKALRRSMTGSGPRTPGGKTMLDWGKKTQTEQQEGTGAPSCCGPARRAEARHT